MVSPPTLATNAGGVGKNSPLSTKTQVSHNASTQRPANKFNWFHFPVTHTKSRPIGNCVQPRPNPAQALCWPNPWTTQRTVSDVAAVQLELELLRTLCYDNADVFLVCFSLVRVSSFDAVATRWLPEIRRLCPSTPVVLVGTQCDRRSAAAAVRRRVDARWAIYCVRHRATLPLSRRTLAVETPPTTAQIRGRTAAESGDGSGCCAASASKRSFAPDTAPCRAVPCYVAADPVSKKLFAVTRYVFAAGTSTPAYCASSYRMRQTDGRTDKRTDRSTALCTPTVGRWAEYVRGALNAFVLAYYRCL